MTIYRKIKRYIGIEIIFIGIALGIPCSLAQYDTVDTYNFAQFLENNNEYYRAITEYERFIFFNSNHSFVDDAQLRIARCYLKGEQFEKAESLLHILLNSSKKKSVLFKTRFSLSEIEYRVKNFQNAFFILNRTQKSLILNEQETFNVEYAKLWNRISDHRLDEALKSLLEIQHIKGNTINADIMGNDIARLGQFKQKSPVLAGTLSVLIPGSGQLYAGRPRDALSAFLWNALFIGATIYAFDSDHDDVAVVLGVFELSWYSANIYNAVNDVNKYNHSSWMNHIRFLERKYPDPYNENIFSN